VTVKDETYKETDIVYKEGVDAIRQNIAMYAGDSSYNGFHHLASEVIDNSVDEALAGYANLVTVVINKDGSCTIKDNGRGIPADIHPEYKISTLEVVLSKIHASGKFTKNAYKKYSSGLHGIGLKLCNALSEWLEVTVQRDGKKYYQKYLQGKAVAPVAVVAESKEHGTEITFKPELKLFSEVKSLDAGWFTKRLRDLSYLNPGIRIKFKDERTGVGHEYYQEKGVYDYVTHLAGSETLLKNHISMSVLEADGIEKEDGKQDEMKLDIVFNYNNSDIETTLCFTNNIFNKDGGSHLSGFQTAVTSCFNTYLRNHSDMLSKKEQKELEGKNLRGEDYRNGLVVVISAKITKPQFAGQTKDRLVNSELQGSIRAAVNKFLTKWIEENPADAKKVVEKAILNFRAHLASKKAAETVKKDAKSLIGNSKKLKDCTEDDPEKTELFIVEGDSAAGAAINGRDYRYQAVLALGGKILNTWRAPTNKMLMHEEISSLIKAIGAGILNNFTPENCRYGKLIIMCDADDDGLHIRTLLLTFFFQRMRKLIEQGKIYIAQPPLYKITYLHKDEKCTKCKGVKNKKISVCSICSGTGKLSKYITYDDDFYPEMEKLGLENSILVDSNDKQYKAGSLLEFVKNNDRSKLEAAGLSKADIENNNIEKVKFKLKNGTKAKAINLTNILELPKAVIELGQNSCNLMRYKGLGEMGGDELFLSTLDPNSRSLIQVTMSDAIEANAYFELFMGNKAEARRDYIIEAKSY